MLIYAVETTSGMQLCGICALNIKTFRNLIDAKHHAINVALCNHNGKVRSSLDIKFDKFLDRTMAVYDESDGDAEKAPALAYITKIDV